MIDKQKNIADFSQIVSNFEEEELELKSISPIDIEQVHDTKSFCKYFSMEIFILILSITIFSLCFLLRDDPFPEKHFKYFDIFYLFLIYLLQTMSFNPFLDKGLTNKYEAIKLKRLDKWKQIKEKYGVKGWSAYMLISTIPLSLIYSIAHL